MKRTVSVALLISGCVTKAAAPATPPAVVPVGPEVCANKSFAVGVDELSRRCSHPGDLDCRYGANIDATVVTVAACPNDRRLVLQATAGELRGPLIGVLAQAGPEPSPLATAKVGDVLRVFVSGYPILKQDGTLFDPGVAYPIYPR